MKPWMIGVALLMGVGCTPKFECVCARPFRVTAFAPVPPPEAAHDLCIQWCTDIYTERRDEKE